MKITSNNYYKNLQSSINNQKNASQPSFSNVLNTKSKNFDQITISASGKQANAGAFAENVASGIREEVHATASEEKLQGIKNDIENGTYKVDIDEIAKKMLLE